MRLFISCLAALVCFGTAHFTLDPAWVRRVPFLRPRDTEGLPEPKTLAPALRWVLAAMVGLASGFAAWRAWTAPDGIERAKLLCALVLVVGAGCIDLTEYRIPNLFPLALALCGIALLAIGLLTGQNGAFSNATGSVLSAVICAACLLIAMFLSRRGIGMGDIKLLAALALCVGFRALIGVIFYGMLFCALTAVSLLIFKKKTIRDAIPFGPFIAFGYLFTLCVRYF